MSSNNEPVKVLAPESFRAKLSRRTLFQVGGAAAGLAILAACGDGKEAASDATSGGGTAAPGATSGGGTVAAGSSDVGDSGTGLGVATGDYSRVVNKSSGTLNMYTWGAYNDPDIVGSLAEKQLGVKMQVSYYTSNEDLITKLEASKGTSGSMSSCRPAVRSADDPERTAREVRQVEASQHGQRRSHLHGAGLGPTNDYSVCKDWGSTGLVLRQDEIKTEIKTWQDFMDVCMGEGSKNCSVLDTPANLAGMYFWANGIDWNTEKKEDLDVRGIHRRQVRLAHQGLRQLPVRQDRRGRLLRLDDVERRRRAPSEDHRCRRQRRRLGVGPRLAATELWMDNYCIAAGAPNPDAAHSWINWILIPEVSIKDLDYHGYNSGMKNMSQLLTELKPDLQYGDMIFFEARRSRP
jgi:spermidine/putrescine transport system substrate-binding protein